MASPDTTIGSKMPELARLLGDKFIERKDVRAVQRADGAYEPIRKPWLMKDLRDHVEGRATYGHYLISSEDKCKLFVYDLDLNKAGCWRDDDGEWHDFNPREAWLDENHPSREWEILQLRCLSEGLAARIQRLYDIQTAISYSGSKGFHVYGFTGSISAKEARAAAVDMLVDWGCFEPTRGQNFFRHTGEPPVGYPNIGIEVFPKQDSLEGKDLGNLVRLPLGVNRKSGQKGFFVDVKQPLNTLREADPVEMLTNGIVW